MPSDSHDFSFRAYYALWYLLVFLLELEMRFHALVSGRLPVCVLLLGSDI